MMDCLALFFSHFKIFYLKFYGFRPHKLEKFNCAGTIQDFAVAILCDLKKPVMSVQNAASWGYFNCQEKSFNTSILEKANFPVYLLPEVKQSGEIAGVLAHKWHSIPKGTPVGKFNFILGHLKLKFLKKNYYVKCYIKIFDYLLRVAVGVEGLASITRPLHIVLFLAVCRNHLVPPALLIQYLLFLYLQNLMVL